MKRLLIASLIAGMAFAASAQTAGTVTIANGSSETVAASQSAPDADLGADDGFANRFCLRSTGSRIVANANARAVKAGKAERQCVPSNGRSYSREDMQRTGEINIAEALRKLDPAIR